MYWANFLHIYQPPTQKPIWVKRIADESYRKIVTGLRDIKRAHLTLNINSILCELLEQNGGTDVIEGIRALLKSGNIEITGSAKYHAFLPLLPEAEIERQIMLNEEGLTKYFGKDWKRGGFFPPEMAYSEKVARVAKKLGYKWIIVDEVAFPKDKKMERDTLYTVDGLDDFYVFFRERNFSFKILSAQQSFVSSLLRFLEPRLSKNEYTVTAMDGETFGHHRPGLEQLLFSLLKEEKIQPVMISDLLKKFTKTESITARSSTWASNFRDIDTGRAYERWNHIDNTIQKDQWELTNLAIAVVERDPKQASRAILDSALHSDQYWWASARPWWSLEMIECGAFGLRKAILDSSIATSTEKEKAELLYKDIIFTGFEWQRTGLVDELSRTENDEVKERLEEKEKLFVTHEEYQQMIEAQIEQMKVAAQNEDFHQASTIKNRIRELREEIKEVQAGEGIALAKKGGDTMF